jgi:tetratricopeptide (TPR) repeat protein
MRTQVFSVIMLLSSSCLSQTILKGFVREQNTGIYIPGALIKSVGANSIESNSSGNFILTFQDLKPGKNIIVRAEKEGWELVNEKEMSTLIPESPDEKTFKIIICKAGTLAKAKSKYYETFELNLERELDKQKALNKGNAKKLANLEKEFARLQIQLSELADEYSRIDLRDASEKERKAIELFNTGMYDEFIALKKSMVTEAQVDRAIKSKAEATKVIANNDSTINLFFKSQRDIANTYLLQFKFKEAEKTYENLAAKDFTNFDNMFDFAYFFQKQKQYEKAIQRYVNALTLAKTEVEIGITQNNLGLLYLETMNYPHALSAFSKALEIYERLAKDDSSVYESVIAMTQSNLGTYYRMMNDYPQALKAYKKALEIRERLAKTSPHIYEESVAITQVNLGSYYQANYDFPAALSAFNKALEIYERLAKDDSSLYEPEVGSIQFNLGGCYQTNDDYPEALKAFSNALSTYERLAKPNPAVYAPEVAKTYHNLGVLHQVNGYYAAAFKASNKALEIYERLARTNPAVYEFGVAVTQVNLGTYYQANGDYAAAFKALNKALEIYQRLAKTNPAVYESEVAMTQGNLGIVYQQTKNYPQAWKAVTNALEIFEQLAKDNPVAYEIHICRMVMLLCFSQKEDYQENRQVKIKEYLSRARQILSKYPQLPSTQTLLKHLNYFEAYFKIKIQ